MGVAGIFFKAHLKVFGDLLAVFGSVQRFSNSLPKPPEYFGSSHEAFGGYWKASLASDLLKHNL